jgi:transposase
MKNYKMIVGIDVSKLKLDVWLMVNPQDSKQEHFIVSNNEKGIKQIIKTIKKQKHSIEDCLFCYENTGIYSMPLSYCLSESGADYWVVPALEIKCSKGITRGKNDKIDAKQIAFYAFTHLHKLKLSTLPGKEIAQLKVLFAEREKRVKAIKILETTKELKGFMPADIVKDTLKMNAQTVAMLKQQLKKLEEKMQKIIERNSKINEQYKLVCSVPGIGKQTAIYLINTTNCFESFDNWRKLACYAGVAPFEYTSGTSVRGRTKVNNLADKKMKSMLQMCVLTAIKNDAELKSYYNKKKEEGKNPMLVMNNIRCKLLARVFAVINRGTPFVNTQKFAA